MTAFDRSSPERIHIVDRAPDVLGWQVHPHEDGRRTSHAIAGEDGVWLFDPLDAANIDDEIADLGSVSGVAVCSNLHGRDADIFADRYDVPVTIPEWVTVTTDLDAPIERVSDRIGPWPILNVPVPGWDEAIVLAHDGETLYTPDVLGTAPVYPVGPERIGLYPFARLRPPRGVLGDLEPARIYCGHGAGVTEDGAAALQCALRGGRRRLPRALLANGPTHLRLLWSVVQDR